VGLAGDYIYIRLADPHPVWLLARVFFDRDRANLRGKSAATSPKSAWFTEMNPCCPSRRHENTSASVRIFMWCEIVGCERLNLSTTCPQDNSPAAATSCTMRKRFGSDNALKTRISFLSSTLGPSRSRESIEGPLVVNGRRRGKSTSRDNGGFR